jgi:hypothetical protein
MKQFEIGDILICHNPIPNDYEIKRIYNILDLNFKPHKDIRWCVTNMNNDYYTIMNMSDGKTSLFYPDVLQKHFIKISEWRNYQINKILN